MRKILSLALAALALLGPAALTREPRASLLVETVYPGADARTVAETIALPIEQQVDGVEKMLHLRSRCANDGTYLLTVVFKDGVDLDRARVRVQKRVALALPTLPDVVKQHGVTVKKMPPGVLALVCVSTPDDSRDLLYLSNYARLVIRDELMRLPGVAEVMSLGQQDYSLLVWLDVQKLAARNLTAADVVKILREQNMQTGAGKIGPPKGKEKDAPLVLVTPGRSFDPDQLANLILKSGTDGRIVRLKDVARFELGANGPDGFALLNGKPVATLAVSPTGQVRPQKLSAALRDRLSQLRAKLPKGVALEATFDFTPNLEAPGKPKTPEYLLLDLDLPASASPERLHRVAEHCDALLRATRGVQDMLALSEGPFDWPHKQPCLLVRLAPTGKGRASREEITRALRKQLEEVRELGGQVCDLSPPGVFPGCGYPVDLAVHGPDADKVRELARRLAEHLRRSKKLTDVWANPDSMPQRQLYVDIDRTALKKLDVSMADVVNTLQVYLGSVDINDFNRFGRTWQVNVRADPVLRKQTEEIQKLKVHNTGGRMVPLGALVKVREVEAPLVIERLDGRPMVEVTANLAAGVSGAECWALCERLVGVVRKELHLSAKYRLLELRMLPERK